MNTAKEAIEIRIQFEKLSESLNQLIDRATKQQTRANKKLLRSEILRLRIIIASMVLSVAIATYLAFYTSRAIASPLKNVTETAQRVTAESNFDLQAYYSLRHCDWNGVEGSNLRGLRDCFLSSQ